MEGFVAILFVLIILTGALECFFGYTIYKRLYQIKGFLIGGCIGALAGGAATFSEAGLFLGLLLGGILGVLLATVFIFLQFFLDSFFVGFLAGAILCVAMDESDTAILVGAVVGLVFGIFGCLLYKTALILVTALSGAMYCGIGVGVLAEDIGIGIIAVIVLFVLGAFVQMRLSGRKQKKEKLPDRIESSDVPAASVAVQENSLTASEPVMPAQPQENREVPPRQSGEGQKRLQDLFEKKIYDEMAYAFPGTGKQKLIYFPKFKEDGSWFCSCGGENSGDVCLFCGMKRSELQEKLNFQYLSRHREERERREKEKREKVWQEQTERVKQAKDAVAAAGKKGLRTSVSLTGKAAEKIRAFWKKYKKPVIILFLIVVFLTGAFAFFTHNSTCMKTYYLLRAEHTEDPGEKYGYYQMALEEKENLDSYLYLIPALLQQGNLNGAIEYNDRAAQAYADDSRYQELAKTLYPLPPRFLAEGGAYDRRFSIELAQDGEKYSQEIHFIFNSDGEAIYQNAIPVTESGVYTVTAWTVNAFGYESERVTAKYQVDIEIPDAVTASLEPGEYESVQYVELAQSGQETIYYTLDGSSPDQNSLVYTEPVKCDFGITQIKAICYSRQGEPSEIAEWEYDVSYEDHTAELGFSGYCFDYLALDGTIRIVDKKTGETKDVLQNSSFPNEYKKRLYYIAQGNINVYDNGKAVPLLTDINAKELLIVHDRLYYKDSDQRLYCTDSTGKNAKLIGDGIVGHLFRSNNRLYFRQGEASMLIENPEEAPMPLPDFSGVTYLYDLGNSLYIYTNKDGLFQRTDGEDFQIFKNVFNTSGHREGGLLFPYNVVESHTERVERTMLSRHMLAYEALTVDTRTEYDWLVETNVDSETSNGKREWILRNLENGETVSLATEAQLFLGDNAYYINGKRMELEH